MERKSRYLFVERIMALLCVKCIFYKLQYSYHEVLTHDVARMLLDNQSNTPTSWNKCLEPDYDTFYMKLPFTYNPEK